MQPSGIAFTVDYLEQPVTIELLVTGKRAMYKAIFTNGTFFFMTKVESTASGDFWTSVPEGKQRLAESIGPLIDARNKALLKPKPKPTKPPPFEPPSLF